MSIFGTKMHDLDLRL